MKHSPLSAAPPRALTGLLSLGTLWLLSMLGQARAQDLEINGAVFTTGPFVAATGEQIVLCVANVSGLTVATAPSPTAGSSPAGGLTLSVTLTILNAATGLEVSSTQLMLPPLGSNAYPPSPCLQVGVPPGAFALTSNSFIAAVALNPQPLPPRTVPKSILRTSLQIYSLDANGNPAGVRVLSFFPPAPCSESPGTAACTVQ